MPKNSNLERKRHYLISEIIYIWTIEFQINIYHFCRNQYLNRIFANKTYQEIQGMLNSHRNGNVFYIIFIHFLH